MGDTIRTGGGMTLDIEGGARVTVKRLRTSEVNKCADAAALASGDSASAMRFTELLVRAAVTGAEGLTLPDGKAVVFGTERHRTLGMIASVDVYDGIPENDLERIVKASRGQLSEEQLGN